MRIIILPLLWLFVSTVIVGGDEKEGLRFIVRHNPPPSVEKPDAPAPFLDQTSELKLAGSALVMAYQTFISPMDAPSCPFSPTCSAYARQAIEKYGLVAGLIKAADRYQRCHGLGARYYRREAGTGRLMDYP